MLSARSGIHEASEADDLEGASELTFMPARSWEFPLSRAEKVERSFMLFQQELEGRTHDHETLEMEVQALRRENASLRAAVQKLASGGVVPGLNLSSISKASTAEPQGSMMHDRRCSLPPTMEDSEATVEPQIRASSFAGGKHSRLSLPLLPLSGFGANAVQETPRWRRNIRQTVQLAPALAANAQATLAQAQAQVQDFSETIEKHASAQVQDFNETIEQVQSVASAHVQDISETMLGIGEKAQEQVQDLSDTVIGIGEKAHEQVQAIGASFSGLFSGDWGHGLQGLPRGGQSWNAFSPQPHSQVTNTHDNTQVDLLTPPGEA
jgi:hypothetical protein